jgi:hypothetical protein
VKPFKWVKNHPVEAAAIAAGVAIGGPMLFEALAPEVAGGAAAASMDPALLGGTTSLAGELGGGSSALLASMDPTLLGGASSLATVPGQFAGAAESSLYGAGVAQNPATALGPPSNWLSKLDPKTVMRVGSMVAQAGGGGQQQGGPQAGAYEQPAMHSALHSQEDITKAWLMKNDPNTYRRIYGNTQGAIA